MRKLRKILAVAAALVLFSSMGTSMVSAIDETGDKESSIVYSAETEKKVPAWVPNDFDSALEFVNKYGKTHVADGVVCLVEEDIYSRSDIWLAVKDNGSTYDYEEHILLSDNYQAPPRAEQDIYNGYYTDLGFSVIVYEVPESETLSISCGTFGGIAAKFNKHYDLSFTADENGNVTETDLYGWLPDCYDEFYDFMEKNENISVQNGYIVFCDEVHMDGGYTIQFESSGTGKAEKVLEYNISRKVPIPVAGDMRRQVIVYKPTASGTMTMKWTESRSWEEDSALKVSDALFEISEDLSVEIAGRGVVTENPDKEEYSEVPGDANNDGKFNVADLIALKRRIIGHYELKVPDSCVDMNGDDTIDVFDVCKMRRMLIEMGFDVSAVELSDGIEADNVTGAEADDEFILSQTQFALSLMQKEVKEDKNVLVSPYSVMQALAMTANGADGNTKAEMEKVLGNGMSIDSLNKYLYTQRKSQPNNNRCKLSTANSIWTKDGMPLIEVYPEFLQKNANYFGAGIFKAPFDFTTVNDINGWVKKNTDNMIPEIIKTLGEDAVMCLVNAVAFDAKWEEQYHEDCVHSGKFTAFNGEKRDVEMMYSDEYSYLEDENATGFLKYYKDGRYAFAALLPNEGVSVTDYISGLTPESLNKILSSPKSTAVNAAMPKFSYDFDTTLNKTLSDMGMPDAFDENTADFSKMGKSVNNLYINKVIHKTHIEVAENGTRAGAATAVIMNDAVACIEVKTVTLNRPFVYCIVDMDTNLPIFIGTLMDVQK